MRILWTVVVLFVLSFVGCHLLRQALAPDATGESPAVQAARGIAPYVPVTWGEGLTGGTLLAQNAYLLWRRLRSSGASS